MEVIKRCWGFVVVGVMWLLILAGVVLVGVDWLFPETRLRGVGLLAFCGGGLLAILMRIDTSVGRVWAAGGRARERELRLNAGLPGELAADEKRKDRPRFRFIKGGLVGAGMWAGVEWLRNGRRLAAALVAGGVAITGSTISEYPGSPGADPPRQVITRPPTAVPTKAVPTKRPTVRPSVALPARGTSPSRRQASTTVAPVTVTPSAVAPTPAKPPSVSRTVAPTLAPTTTPIVSLPVTPTIAPSLPAEVVTPTCAINLLGIRVCLPLG